MRKASGTDFHVDVEWKNAGGTIEQLGRFTFGRRTMRDVFLIRSEYNRLTNFNYNDAGMAADIGAWAVASLSVLMVEAPATFDMDKADPIMDDTWEDKAACVFSSLRDKELSFRQNSRKEVQGASQGTSHEHSTGVSEKVPAAANGF